MVFRLKGKKSVDISYTLYDSRQPQTLMGSLILRLQTRRATISL